MKIRTIDILFLMLVSMFADANHYINTTDQENETFDIHFAKLLNGDDFDAYAKAKTVKRDSHSEDFVLAPDVIFLFQRSGVSESDFGFIKKFVGRSVYCLRKIGATEDGSRLGLSLFTHKTRRLVDFRNCCENNRTTLLKMVDKSSMYDQAIVRNVTNGDHSFVTPHNINIKSAFRIIKGRNLRNDIAMRKPTLIIFVANFQTPYQSFRLFLEAVSDIEACKRAGAWVAVIIVDPQANRQPRLQESDLRLSRDALNMMRTKNGRESILFHHIRPSKNYILQDHVDFIRKLDKVQRNFLGRVEELHRERAAGEPLEYNQLALLYAKVLASHRDDGFKINYYADLVRHPVFTSVKRLLTKPTSWFGEGEISSSCPDTKHFLERTIWSPDFFESNTYPNTADCEWKIKARKGFFLNLQFDYIKTEEMYDVVLVYDGFVKDSDSLLGNFSGDYTEINPMPSVNSTEELLLVHFKSDAAHFEVGFRATWTPYGMPDRIDDAQVLFLVDVSASLHQKDFKPIKGWIKKATKSFYFKGKPESQKERMARLGILEEPKGSSFGLIMFDVMNYVLSSIIREKSRSEFFDVLTKITHTMRTTYLGHALDFARLRQFYLLSGTDIPFPANARATNKQNQNEMEKEKEKIPRRVIFIFSDVNSNDNPAHAARRLCQADIVPVLIAMGRVSIRGKSLITSYCGLTFDINVPVPQVIYALKHHLGLITNETTTAMPPLPTKPTFPTRIRYTKPPTTTTTTTTTTPTPEEGKKKEPFYVRQTLKPQPQPRPITYFYFAGTLAGIGFMELLVLLATLYYHYCTDSSIYTRPSDSEESIVLEDEEGNKLPKELPEYPTTTNSFFDRFAAPFAKRKKNIPGELLVDQEAKKSHCCELKANSQQQDANKK